MTETATVAVTITSVNDAPVNTVPVAATTNANTPIVFSATNDNGLSIVDVDAGAEALTVTLTATQGTLTLPSVSDLVFAVGSGAADAKLSFSGTLRAINSALSGLVFAPATGFSGSATVTLSTSDNGNSGAGGALVATNVIAITVLDTIPPVVVNLAAVTAAGYYRVGATLDVSVTFSEIVTVNSTGGVPSLLLDTGTIDRAATYVSGSGSAVLVFRYMVAAGDTTGDLNHESVNALGLNGGRIQDLAGNAANLTLPETLPGTSGALATTAALVVDTTAPTVVCSAPSVTRAGPGPVTYTLTFADEYLVAPSFSASDVTLHRTVSDSRLVAAAGIVAVSGSGATRTITISGITGDGTLSISLPTGTVADLAGNFAPAVGPAEAFMVENTFPIVGVTAPVGRTIAVGMPLLLSVTVEGTTPAFQWFKAGSLIPGATQATLEIAATPLTAAGLYHVTTGNALGSIASAPVAVTVFDVTASHAAIGPGYVPGQTLTLRNTVTFAGGDGTLTWSLLLPAGWSYLGGEVESDLRPAVGARELLEWEWRSFALSPVTFTVELQVPVGTTGPQALAAQVTCTRAGVTVPLLAKPDPLIVTEIAAHSADSNRDGRIGLLELLRVIEFYNVRAATLRTGAYEVAPGTEDGFAPALTWSAGARTALPAYHSADMNQDGCISLFELVRVIELYNYRQGNSRTGEYHRQAGTEDGFTTGPGASPP